MADDQIQAQLQKLQDALGQSITLDPSRKKQKARPVPCTRRSPQFEWQEQYLSYKKLSDNTVPSSVLEEESAYLDFDETKLCTGEPLDENIQFCPYEKIKQYPEQFIGKANRPLARPFFDNLLESKTWHFFELGLPDEPGKTCLLLPAIQFVDFLKEINAQIETRLCIPKGKPSLPFALTFGHGDTPRPRYIGPSPEKPRVVIDNHRVINEDIERFKSAAEHDRDMWLDSWQKATAASEYHRANTSLSAKLAAEKAEKKRIEMETMLARVQSYLGRRGVDCIDDLAGKPVLFISVDIEVHEENPRCITEIGIAVLDTRNIQTDDGTRSVIYWCRHIKARHLVVRQHASHVNHKFVQGCPDMFQFGESEFPNECDLIRTLTSILYSYTRDNEVDVVLVGHNIQADVRYLATAGYDVARDLKLFDTIDTQVLHQAWKGGQQPRKLENVLSDLGMAYAHLHNAGNDATYTLRAMLALGTLPQEHRSAP